MGWKLGGIQFGAFFVVIIGTEFTLNLTLESIITNVPNRSNTGEMFLFYQMDWLCLLRSVAISFS